MMACASIYKGVRTAGIIAEHAADAATVAGGGFGAEEQAVWLQSKVQLIQDDTWLHSRPTFFLVDFQYFLEMLADVDHDTASHHLTSDGSATSSWDEMGLAFACRLGQVDNILFVFGISHRLGYLTISRRIGGVGDAVQRVGVKRKH